MRDAVSSYLFLPISDERKLSESFDCMQSYSEAVFVNSTDLKLLSWSDLIIELSTKTDTSSVYEPAHEKKLLLI